MAQPHLKVLTFDAESHMVFGLSNEMWAGTDSNCDIPLVGVGVKGQHAQFFVADGKVTITKGPLGGECVVNGDDETKKELTHNDRIRLGNANFYLYQDPAVLSTLNDEQKDKDLH